MAVKPLRHHRQHALPGCGFLPRLLLGQPAPPLPLDRVLRLRQGPHDLPDDLPYLLHRISSGLVAAAYSALARVEPARSCRTPLLRGLAFRIQLRKVASQSARNSRFDAAQSRIFAASRSMSTPRCAAISRWESSGIQSAGKRVRPFRRSATPPCDAVSSAAPPRPPCSVDDPFFLPPVGGFFFGVDLFSTGSRGRGPFRPTFGRFVGLNSLFVGLNWFRSAFSRGSKNR